MRIDEECQEIPEESEQAIIDEPTPVQSIEETPEKDATKTTDYKIVNVPEIIPSGDEEPEM